jgi:metal-sulfur cluster biosynthetic enzyme
LPSGKPERPSTLTGDGSFRVPTAIGKEPALALKSNLPMLTQEEIYEVLSECYDPEIPVNIVDLGLVYGVAVHNGTVTVQMTLTAPGCTMGSMIATEIEDKLLGLPDCERANVEIVWEPPWTPHRMSEAARKQLGMDD